MAEPLGLKDVLAKFEAIGDDVKRKGGRFALRRAAQLVRDAAAANAARIDDPATAANISKNVAERWSGKVYKSSRGQLLMFRVGVLGGAGGNKPAEAFAHLPGKDTRHWRHMEFGARQMEFGTESKGAQPFLRRALSENTGAAIQVFAREYEKALARAVKRAGKL